jgi:hypothetical protein
MNPVEEGAVAGDVGAEPAGGRNDHGQRPWFQTNQLPG